MKSGWCIATLKLVNNTYHQSKSREKIVKTTKIGAEKLLLCVFWDKTGIILAEFLEPGNTVDSQVYHDQMNWLKEALHEKRPSLVNRKQVYLLHDNARPHVANTVKNLLEGFNWIIIDHPPYSPDLAPSDFHLFRSLSNLSCWKKFRNFWGLQKCSHFFFRLKKFEILWKWNFQIEKSMVRMHLCWWWIFGWLKVFFESVVSIFCGELKSENHEGDV